jgi:competence transcription factor ComK
MNKIIAKTSIIIMLALFICINAVSQSCAIDFFSRNFTGGNSGSKHITFLSDSSILIFDKLLFDYNFVTTFVKNPLAKYFLYRHDGILYF